MATIATLVAAHSVPRVAVASTTNIYGKLSFSRVAHSTLTLVGGDITVRSGGYLDMGNAGSPIPAGTTAQLILAYGTSKAGQYGLIVEPGGNYTVYGTPKEITTNLDTVTALISEDHEYLVPRVLMCDRFAPSDPSVGNLVARKLDVPAVVWGEVIAAGSRYDISTSVADAQDGFAPPFTATSHEVDLGHPHDAVISPITRAAILVAVMSNLESKEQWQAAIYVSKQVGDLAAAAAKDSTSRPRWAMLSGLADSSRVRCQSRLPHARLLGGGD